MMSLLSVGFCNLNQTMNQMIFLYKEAMLKWNAKSRMKQEEMKNVTKQKTTKRNISEVE